MAKMGDIWGWSTMGPVTVANPRDAMSHNEELEAALCRAMVSDAPFVQMRLLLPDEAVLDIEYAFVHMHRIIEAKQSIIETQQSIIAEKNDTIKLKCLETEQVALHMLRRIKRLRAACFVLACICISSVAALIVVT